LSTKWLQCLLAFSSANSITMNIERFCTLILDLACSCTQLTYFSVLISWNILVTALKLNGLISMAQFLLYYICHMAVHTICI